MSAGRICTRTVVTVSPTETVRTAARRMAEHEVGTLVVLTPNGADRPLGILTDRDITIRAVAPGVDLDRTPVSAVMTAPVRSVDERTTIEDAILTMGRAATRRLVVTGPKGRAVGILSLDDVLDLLIGEVGPIGRLLDKQRPHMPA